MEEDLRALLAADPGVAALVGPRITWGHLPQGAGWPAVALYLVSRVPEYTLRGPAASVPHRVQIDCVAAGADSGAAFAAAVAVGRAVEAALSGRRAGGIEGAFLDGSRQDSAPGPTEGSRVFRVSLDFIVNHKES